MDSALAAGPHFSRRLRQGFNCIVCVRRPKPYMEACLLVASLRYVMLAQFLGQRIRQGYTLH
eukprot:730798-Pyramimonas_sp.AAC.1